MLHEHDTLHKLSFTHPDPVCTLLSFLRERQENGLDTIHFLHFSQLYNHQQQAAHHRGISQSTELAESTFTLLRTPTWSCFLPNTKRQLVPSCGQSVPSGNDFRCALKIKYSPSNESSGNYSETETVFTGAHGSLSTLSHLPEQSLTSEDTYLYPLVFVAPCRYSWSRYRLFPRLIIPPWTE